MTTCVKIWPCLAHRVVALLPERVAAFELGIVVEVFGLERPELDVPWWYELTLCTEHPGRAAGDRGRLRVRRRARAGGAGATPTRSSCPGWNGEPSDGRAGGGARGRARGSSRSAAACSCSPRRACSRAARRRRTGATRSGSRRAHPELTVNADVLYVDGDDVLTSRAAPRGSTSACTSCAATTGRAVANAVARRLVIPPHRDGGQAQLIDLPMPAHPDDDPIARVMAWALERLDDAAGPGHARRAGVHERAHVHAPLPARDRARRRGAG